MPTALRFTGLHSGDIAGSAGRAERGNSEGWCCCKDRTLGLEQVGTVEAVSDFCLRGALSRCALGEPGGNQLQSDRTVPTALRFLGLPQLDKVPDAGGWTRGLGGDQGRLESQAIALELKAALSP